MRVRRPVAAKPNQKAGWRNCLGRRLSWKAETPASQSSWDHRPAVEKLDQMADWRKQTAG